MSAIVTYSWGDSPQEQTCSQAKGIQLVKAPNNEVQQPVIAKVPFHHIPTKQEEIREPQLLSTSWILTP